MQKKNIDCILLNPYFTYVKGSIYREISSLDPPLGLISLSSYLISRGIHAMVYDLNVEIRNNHDLAGFIRKIAENYQFSKPFFGISFLTPYVSSSYELAAAIKAEIPESIVIAGGSHASFMAEELLSNHNIDLVVRGEGELSLEEVLRGIPVQDIKGLSYKAMDGQKPKIIHNEDRERIMDIDSLPMPAYDQLKIRKYQPILGSYRRLPAANIITTRGCTGSCNFCCKTFGNKVTFRSPKKIVEEIRYLVDMYKVKHINIYDDTFTLNRSRVIEFCDLLSAESFRVEWTCFARIDTMDMQLLQKMKAAGCYQIMYGVENFNQAILDSISKNIESSKVSEVVKMTKQAGIVTRVSMMIGNPKDTWDTFNNNIKALKKVKPDIVVASIFTPIPGSALYRWALENDRLLTRDWSRFAGNNSVMRLDFLSQKDVVKQYHKIYSTYYYNLPYLIGRLGRINTLTGLWMSVKAFFYILKFVISK